MTCVSSESSWLPPLPAKLRDFVLIYFGEPGSESFKWPNFNVADMCIVFGVGFVMWDALFGLGAKEAKAQAERKKRAKARGGAEA